MHSCQNRRICMGWQGAVTQNQTMPCLWWVSMDTIHAKQCLCVTLSIINFLVYVNSRNQTGSPECKLFSCLAWQPLCSNATVASCPNWACLQKLIFKHQLFNCEVSRGELYLISCVGLSQTLQWLCQLFCGCMINNLNKVLRLEADVAWFH